jgi:hypothetical protein
MSQIESTVASWMELQTNIAAEKTTLVGIFNED